MNMLYPARLAFVVLLCSSQIFAATYYLDAVNGNDNSSGSLSSPWKTFSKAQSVVASGDTVLMRNGSYGPFSQTKAYASFVTYKNDTGAIPAIGSVSLGSGSAYLRFEGLKIDGTANLYGGDHVELINCTIRYPGDRYGAPANLVDIRYTKFGLVKNCSISHGKTGIKIDNATNPTVSGNKIFDLAVDALTATPSTNFLLEYNHIFDLHQDRFRLKDDWTAWPFIPANSSITVSDKLYQDIIVSVPSGFATGVLAYVNFPEAKSFAQINNFSITINPSIALSAGNLAMRVATQTNGGTGTQYVDIPIGAAAANTDNVLSLSITSAKAITAVRSIALVLTADKSAFTLNINNWGGSNGAHQDFIVFSGNNITIRNNIMHDGANQGIFTSPANGDTVIIENNLIYDMEGTNLLNLTMSGPCSIRNNTFIGYFRPGYTDPFSKYHLSGIALLNTNDGGAGFRVYNNIVAGELSSLGGYNDYNIVTRQTTPGAHTLVISGTNPNRYNFDQGFFDKINITRYHCQYLDYFLAPASGATNFTRADDQPSTSLGTLDANGFVQRNGITRDTTHRSAGAHELGQSSSPINTPPQIAAIADQHISTIQEFSLSLIATDAEDDPLTWSVQDLPAGAVFSGNTFSWTPQPDQLGTYNVTFTVSDGKLTASKIVTITVANVADLDNNGRVDAVDFASLAKCWYASGAGLAEDINKDGIVDSADFMLFAQNWLTGIEVLAGPVAIWHFDESSGTSSPDSSGNDNTAELINGPLWTTGRFDNGLQFDGLDDAVQINIDKMNAQQGTISLWANPAGFTTMPNYLFGHAASDWTNRIQLYISSAGTLNLGLGDTHSCSLNIAQCVTGTWYHVVLTWQGTEYAVYVDGVLKASGTYTGLNNLLTSADIGNDGTFRNESFGGIIDEVCLYDRAISAAEVLKLFNM